MGAAWSGETEPRVKGQSFWDQRRAHSNLDFNSSPSSFAPLLHLSPHSHRLNHRPFTEEIYRQKQKGVKNK